MATDNKKFNAIICLGPESIQGSPEWREFRKGKIGSSDVPIILGLSPWESPLEFWNRRILGKEIEANHAMKRGSELEDRARQILNRQTRENYQPCVLQSMENKSLIASLDGLWISEDGKVHIAEIKCPGEKTHSLAKIGMIPEHYIPQLCHQCMISGADTCLYVSWDGLSDHVEIIEYRPADAMCERIRNETQKFLDSLEDFTSPSAQNRDWVQCFDEQVIHMANRYKYVGELIDELTKERDFLRESLIMKIEHPKTIVNGLKIQKTYKNGTIDYSKIPELEGVDLEQYRKEPTESWRISLR